MFPFLHKMLAQNGKKLISNNFIPTVDVLDKVECMLHSNDKAQTNKININTEMIALFLTLKIQTGKECKHICENTLLMCIDNTREIKEEEIVSFIKHSVNNVNNAKLCVCNSAMQKITSEMSLNTLKCNVCDGMAVEYMWLCAEEHKYAMCESCDYPDEENINMNDCENDMYPTHNHNTRLSSKKVY